MHCTKYKEQAPFFEGLVLEYDVGRGYKLIYNFHSLENNKFKIIETDTTRVMGNDVKELFVDGYGKVYESTFKPYEERFSVIWIPVHKMENGDSFDGGFTVVRKDKWKKWEVLVIKNPNVEEEQYYELNRGYLVGVKGSAGRSYEVVLINTNADIPVMEKDAVEE